MTNRQEIYKRFIISPKIKKEKVLCFHYLCLSSIYLAGKEGVMGLDADTGINSF